MLASSFPNYPLACIDAALQPGNNANADRFSRFFHPRQLHPFPWHENAHQGQTYYFQANEVCRRRRNWPRRKQSSHSGFLERTRARSQSSDQDAAESCISGDSLRDDCSEKHESEPMIQQAKEERQSSFEEQDKNVQVDIAPSVFRIFEGGESSADGTPSLIEKNLRKRAARRPKLTALKDGQLASDASIGQPLPVSSPDFSTNQSSEGTIQQVHWDKAPAGVSIDHFLTKDAHANAFRLVVLIRAVLQDYLSPASIVWFLLPFDSVSLPPGLPADLNLFWAKWRTILAKDLRELIGNSRDYVEAGELYWKLWCDHNGSALTSTEFQTRLPLLSYLALTLEIEMLGAARRGDQTNVESSLEKRIRESFSALAGAGGELLKDVLDVQGLWEHSIKGTSFVADGKVFIYEEGVFFSGRVVGDADALIGEVQKRLDDRFPNRVALLLKSETELEQSEVYLVISPWFWLLSVDWNSIAWLFILLFGGALMGTMQFTAAYLAVDNRMFWEQYAVAFGLLGVFASGLLAMKAMASRYNASHLVGVPLVFTVPHQLGAVGRWIPLRGCLPSCSCLLDISLASSFASLAFSFLLIAAGYTFWGPSEFLSTSVVDFHGYVLVPSDMFSFSAIFTMLLKTLSVSVINGEDGVAAMAVSPFALSGLLGLSLTSFSLIPASCLEGNYILKSVYSRSAIGERISIAATVSVVLSLILKNPMLGFGWLMYTGMAGAGEVFMRNEISEPTLAKRMAGLVLMLAAVIFFIPAF